MTAQPGGPGTPDGALDLSSASRAGGALRFRDVATGMRPIASRFRRLRPSLQGTIALLAYATAWTLIVVRSLVFHPGLPQLDQASMDPNMYVWCLRWWPYAVSHGLNPLQVNVIGAPSGFNLAWVTTVPPVALLTAPITAAFGPLVTFNLLVAFGPPLSAWATFVVCRRLTKRFWPSLAGGIVYGFSAYEINHTVPGQLNITVSLLLPLMAYLVLLWRDGSIGRVTFTALMTLALILQLFLFLETFAELTLFLVGALPIGYLLAKPGARRQIIKLSRYLGIAYAATLVLASPYLYYTLKHRPAGFVRSPKLSALNTASLVTPRPVRSFGVSWLTHFSASVPQISDAGYVGIPLLVLVICFAILTWRSRLTKFLVIMFVFVLVVSIGPNLMIGGTSVAVPWSHLWNLPIAQSAFPIRMMVFGYLILSVIVAVWLAAPKRRPSLRWLLGLLAVAAVLADIGPVGYQAPPVYAQNPPFIATGQYRHYLRPGETVLVVSGRGNAGLLWQAETNFYFKLSGGYINEAITQGTDLPGAVQLLAQPNPYVDLGFVDFLRQAKVGAVLVDANWPPRWVASFEHLGLHSRLVGGVLMFELPHAQ